LTSASLSTAKSSALSLTATLAASAASTPALGCRSRYSCRNRRSARAALPIFGHLHREISGTSLLADCHLLMRGSEPQNLNLDVPHARSEAQSIVPVFVGVTDNFHVALGGCHCGAGDWLVGGDHVAALLRRAQKSRSQRKNQENKNRKTPHKTLQPASANQSQ
jgi:hypothetical protein